MKIIESASEINDLAAKEEDSGGVYFVTAFSGLLAPYWDSGAAGLIIGISQYTNPSHIARATLEANAFQTRAVIESMKLDSGSDLKHLKVDGGMTNGDLAMTILADISGFDVVRPEMREYVEALFLFFYKTINSLFFLPRSTALGAALCAGAAVKAFGWDLSKPETLSQVNTKGTRNFAPTVDVSIREEKWKLWQKAVERSRNWDEGVDA